MALKFKKRGKEDLKKVMVYGKDGTGKSTFAETYCNENCLKPVVIDVDDTNYTDLPILELNLKTDIKTFTEIKKAIEEIAKLDDFDTIILDGVTSLLEMLVSDARGLAKYSDRASRFQKILQALLSSGKNLIFIGQADMEVIFSEEFQSSKMVIKVNSLVNEKYLCEVDDKGNFTHKVMKFRTFKKSDEVPEDDEDNDPIKQTIDEVKEQLTRLNKPITKSNMRSCVVRNIKKGLIEQDMRPKLIKYIETHCPENN
ncbi:MAG: AAA family ATPase [Bacilli bacterium]|nr:AAA family ATPase [Bacilli bacterium]